MTSALEQKEAEVEARRLTAVEDLERRSPALEALVHWLTGVVFAVILGGFLILVAPNVPGLSDLLRLVSDKGSDLAMRVRAVSHGSKDLLPVGVSGFVFIDVDPVACARAGLGGRCQDRSPADPSLVAAYAAGVLRDAPRTLILDANLWDTDPGRPQPQAAFAALASAARAHPASPVVAAGPYRPGAQPQSSIFEPGLTPASLAGGPISFAPSFLVLDPRQEDDVVRGYTPSSRIEGRPQAAPRAPTLPMLAALYVQAQGNLRAIGAINCRLGQATGTGPAACSAPAATTAIGPGSDARLVFTLPSAVRAQHVASTVYRRFLASQAFDQNNALLLDPAALKDAVVVISTSAASALDTHPTPLGDMAGAEVVLNAVQALSTHGWVREPDMGQRLGHEIEIIGVSSLPFLAFWLLYFTLEASLPAGRGTMILLHAYGLCGFLAAIGLAMVAAGVVTLAAIDRGVASGFTVEFFTPIFALSLEGFAEGAGWILGRIEVLVDFVLQVLAGRVKRVFVAPRPGERE